MIFARKQLKIVALFAALGALVGCSHAYLDAVTCYATTSGDGLKSLRSVPATAAIICRKRSAARYLKLHLLGTPPSERWEDYYGAKKEADGTLSWKEYCADIRDTGRNFSALVSILTAYTNAIKSLAEQGTWDGTALKDLTKNLSTLSGATTPAGQVLSGLAPAAQQLGKGVVAKYAGNKTHEFAAIAEPHIQAILSGLRAYLDAVEKDVVEPATKERIEAVNLLETKGNVWTEPLDSGRAIEFVDYAKSVDDDVASVQSTFASYKTLITKLKAGHTVLANKAPEEPSAKDIVAAMTDILTALAEVETKLSANTSSD